MSANNSITVYGLASSKDGVIRYIGQTSRDLETRRKWHITWTLRKRDRSRRTAWIASVLREGHELTITALEVDAVKHESEIRWIAHYKERGFDLVNGTLGGDQCIGVPKTEAHKAAISAAHKGSKKPWTAERNRQGKGKPGHASTPEINAKIAAKHIGKPKPWAAERNKTIVWTDEMRAKVGDANRRITLDDVRDIKRRLASGEKQSAIARGYNISDSLVSQIKLGKKYAEI